MKSMEEGLVTRQQVYDRAADGATAIVVAISQVTLFMSENRAQTGLWRDLPSAGAEGASPSYDG